MRISDDCLEVLNPGSLPHGISVQSLYHQHRSSPRNVLIAGAIFRARLIEHWGTGTLRIIDACREHNIKVEFENEANTFIVRLRQLSPLFSAQPPSGVQSGVQSEMQRQILGFLRKEDLAKKGIAERLGKSGRTRYLNDLVRKLIVLGLIERTIPDKPNSRLQKYRLTLRGKALVGHGSDK